MESETPASTETEERLAELERQVRSFRSELADIRNVISSGYEVLFRANETRAAEVSAILGRLNELEECLMPAFFKVFPKQGPFLDEVDALLRSRREK